MGSPCSKPVSYTHLHTPAFDFEKAAIALSDRHFGIGGDGIILVCPSDHADAKMRIFNADGSEGMMCGNGIRCVGKYVYDSGIARKNQLQIDSLSGVKILDMTIQDGKAVAARVDIDVYKRQIPDLPLPDSRKMAAGAQPVSGHNLIWMIGRRFDKRRLIL